MGLNKINNNYDTPLEIKNLQVNDMLSVGTNLTTNETVVNGVLYAGVDSVSLATIDHYTAPAAIISLDNPNNYIQLALKNTASGTNSSADYIAYPDNGNDDFGYIDMGITSSVFSDPKFVLTKSNDGYLFMSGVKDSKGISSITILNGIATVVTAVAHGYNAGDVVRIELNNGAIPTAYYAVTIVNIIDQNTFALTVASTTYISGVIGQVTNVYKTTGNGSFVVATDATGAANNIVFAAGGLASDTSQMTISPNSITLGTTNTGTVAIGGKGVASTTITGTSGQNTVTL
jgi:hypothetical protein